MNFANLPGTDRNIRKIRIAMVTGPPSGRTFASIRPVSGSKTAFGTHHCRYLSATPKRRSNREHSLIHSHRRAINQAAALDLTLHRLMLSKIAHPVGLLVRRRCGRCGRRTGHRSRSRRRWRRYSRVRLLRLPRQLGPCVGQVLAILAVAHLVHETHKLGIGELLGRQAIR